MMGSSKISARIVDRVGDKVQEIVFDDAELISFTQSFTFGHGTRIALLVKWPSTGMRVTVTTDPEPAGDDARE